MNKYTERIPLLDQIKIPMQLNTPLRRIRRWHYFWPISWLILIALGQIFVTVDVIGLEIASLILNMKYSFFFIGLMAAFFFIITWTSTFVNGTFLFFLIKLIIVMLSSLLLSTITWMCNVHSSSQYSSHCCIECPSIL